MEANKFEASVRLEDLRQAMDTFVEERGWHKFHTPRNLVLALVGEVGELAEIFQWRGEVSPGLPDWSEADRTHLGEELSDCLLYLVRLSDRCGIDLASAAIRKMSLNRSKYPVDRCFGSSAKYTAYSAASGAPQSSVSVTPSQTAPTATSAGDEMIRTTGVSGSSPLNRAIVAAVSFFAVFALTRAFRSS